MLSASIATRFDGQHQALPKWGVFRTAEPVGHRIHNIGAHKTIAHRNETIFRDMSLPVAVAHTGTRGRHARCIDDTELSRLDMWVG